ncbi:unnamed protein product [Paramecium pentaurelia]|uniref:Uncharacterized protein n=1 Tax=Paramecium pentaurelia TaxID=43138 RepID=A0A8S1X455_9CILI|nr:unnamed protein product [Paramecium pentaurelia]
MKQEEDEKLFIDTVQTQQLEIESLKKQIRLQEFQSKQQHLELINSLDQLKKRNEELDIELNKQIESTHETQLQQFALQMQDQLAKAEEQILIYQENELKLIKEIQQLQGKLESDKINDLKKQLVKMEETAIALIVEKEFIISEQAKEIELLKQNEKFNNQQIENNTQILDIQELENKIQDYQYKIEHQQQLHEEQLSNLERIITNRIFESLELEMNQKKLVEQDLLHQIHILEEKNKYYEKLLNEQERKLNIFREEKNQEQTLYDKKYQEISERLRYALQQIIKSDKKCEDAYKQFSQLQREKQNMTKQKEELIRKQVYLENQNRKHTQVIQEYKELIDTLQQQVNEQDQIIQEQNEQLQKLSIHYEQQLKIAIQSHQQKFEFNDNEIASNQNALLSDLLKDSQISQNNQNTHIDSPTHSIQQTHTSHLSDSYCSFQTKNSSRRRVGNDCKYENIKDALLDAKHTIKIQNLEISNLEQTVEILQKELKSQLLEIHNLRKTKLDFKQDKDYKLEIEKLKQCLNTMETHYLTTKLSLAEEINFLKDELKRAESEALRSKLQLTQLNAQFCIIQQKYQKLDKQQQQSLTNRQIQNIDEKSPVKGRKSIFSIFG